MNETSGKKHGSQTAPRKGGGAAAEREARLKAALRANLQRRKAQSRGRAEEEAEEDLPDEGGISGQPEQDV